MSRAETLAAQRLRFWVSGDEAARLAQRVSFRLLRPSADAVVAVAAALWGARGEFLALAALLAGWGLVTDAVARLAPPAIVWRLSVGVFALSCFGWTLLYRLAADGLYVLHMTAREEREKREKRGG